MLRKAIGATFMLLLMTGAVCAQMSPTLHLKNDTPSRSKEQKEYDKALDKSYQSELKKIPDAGKKDPWGDIRSTPPSAPRTNNK